MSQPAVQGVDFNGEVIEATRCLRMLDRPALVGLTLRPQTGQSLVESSFPFVHASALGAAEVFYGTSSGGVVRPPVGQLGPPRLALSPGGAAAGEVALHAGDVHLGLVQLPDGVGDGWSR